VNVRIPTPLRSYTDQRSVVEADGSTVDDVLLDLDRQFPGIRFRMVDEQGRIRRHMRVFINDEATRDLRDEVAATDELTIMQALSGGSHDTPPTTHLATSTVRLVEDD
jgi:sulfur-carrier protein